MHVRVPLPGLVVMAKVTDDVSVVTVWPFASCTVTTGWVVQAVPPVHPAGVVVNASFVAGPNTASEVVWFTDVLVSVPVMV